MMQVFDGGQPTDIEMTNCSEKEGATLNRAVMNAEQLFIDKNLAHNLLWRVLSRVVGGRYCRANLSRAGNVLSKPVGADVFNQLRCVLKVLLLINRRDEHLGSCGRQSNLHGLVCVTMKAVGTPKYPCGQFSAVGGQLFLLGLVQEGGN